jgi:hypothetical protein
MNKTLILMERALSVLEGYDGWVIGKCDLTYSGTSGGKMPAEYRTETVKRGSSLAMATVSGENDFLKILLVKPSPKNGGKSRKTGSRKAAEVPLFFSENQVETYLNEVSDYNPIHKGQKAIVPGLLMMNRILEQIIPAPVSPFHAETRFLAPFPVGGEARLSVLQEEGGKINASLWALDGTEVLKVEVCQL